MQALTQMLPPYIQTLHHIYRFKNVYSGKNILQFESLLQAYLPIVAKVLVNDDR